MSLELATENYYDTKIRRLRSNLENLQRTIRGHTGDDVLTVMTYEKEAIMIGGCFGGRVGTKVDQILKLGILAYDEIHWDLSQPDIVIPTVNYVQRGHRYPVLNRDWEIQEGNITLPLHEEMYLNNPLTSHDDLFDKGRNLTVLVGSDNVERYFMLDRHLRIMLIEQGELQKIPERNTRFFKGSNRDYLDALGTLYQS